MLSYRREEDLYQEKGCFKQMTMLCTMARDAVYHDNAYAMTGC